MNSIKKATKLTGRRLQGQRGFSLVELLVAMVLMIVVVAAIYTIWFGLQRSYSFTDDDMSAQEQARAAMGEMVEYIRTARQPVPAPSEELNMVIVAADANSLVCWTDADRDPDHYLELVRFRVDTASRTLYRDICKDRNPATLADAFASGNMRPTRLVANWLSNDSTKALFVYTAANGTVLPTPVADPSLIREVAINLRIDVYTEKAPIAHQLHSVVQPRNLRQY